jgi:hypothetical protein
MALVLLLLDNAHHYQLTDVVGQHPVVTQLNVVMRMASVKLHRVVLVA